jgi:hypothetical protein
MSALIPLVLTVTASFGCGYGVRALISKPAAQQSEDGTRPAINTAE